MQSRAIFVGSDIDDASANNIVSQLLYLSTEDSVADITMYIQSNGGSLDAVMTIFDTMQFIPNNINTVCYGSVRSLGTFLLAAGTIGRRVSFPSSRIVLQQPYAAVQGEVR